VVAVRGIADLLADGHTAIEASPAAVQLRANVMVTTDSLQHWEEWQHAYRFGVILILPPEHSFGSKQPACEI
jgi:hypothetical protein